MLVTVRVLLLHRQGVQLLLLQPGHIVVRQARQAPTVAGRNNLVRRGGFERPVGEALNIEGVMQQGAGILQGLRGSMRDRGLTTQPSPQGGGEKPAPTVPSQLGVSAQRAWNMLLLGLLRLSLRF